MNKCGFGMDAKVEERHLIASVFIFIVCMVLVRVVCDSLQPKSDRSQNLLEDSIMKHVSSAR